MCSSLELILDLSDNAVFMKFLHTIIVALGSKDIDALILPFKLILKFIAILHIKHAVKAATEPT